MVHTVLCEIILEAGYTPIRYYGNVGFFTPESFLMSLSRLIHEAHYLDHVKIDSDFKLDQLLDIIGAENIRVVTAGVGKVIYFPSVKWGN